MTSKKYTNILLAIIAIGIIGINFYLFKINIINNVNASTDNKSVLVSSFKTTQFLISSDGKHYCAFNAEYVNKWQLTGC